MRSVSLKKIGASTLEMESETWKDCSSRDFTWTNPVSAQVLGALDLGDMILYLSSLLYRLGLGL